MDWDFIENEEQREKAKAAHAESIETLKTGIDGQITEAVSKLQQKNEDIIAEKRAIQEKLENFKDLDPEEIKTAIEKARKAEEDAMSAEERAAKKYSDMQNDHTSIMEELQGKLEIASKNEVSYKNQFEGKVIEDDLRAQAVAAGVRPEAVEDVVMQGRMVFSLGEDAAVEARAKDGSLLKNDDGIIVTSKIWMEGLKKNKAYFWPNSSGADMTGNFSGDQTENLDKLAALIAKGDMAGYRVLKAKLDKAK